MDSHFFVSSSSCQNCGKDVNSSHECEFKVAWQINPHMKIGQTSPVIAHSQHRKFISALVSAGASVDQMPFVHGAFDSVFAKDNALIARTAVGLIALLGRPKTDERAMEQSERRRFFESIGIDVVGQSRHYLEGGDIVMHPNSDCVFLGHGFRTDFAVLPEVEHFLGQRVIALELTDPHFYHLDTALALTHGQRGLVAFAYKGAFTEAAWTRLQNEESITRIVEVTREEALKFGLNWVEVRDEIIIGSEVPQIASSLKSLGKKVNVASLSQFQLAGGSAACLVTEVHDLRNNSSSPVLRPSIV